MKLWEGHEILRRYELGVLATVTADHEPSAALVGIAFTPDLHVIFDTLRSSRKYQNLVAHPRVALVVGWEGEMTFQLEGFAGPVRDARDLEVYFARHPLGRQRALSADVTHFVIRPTWIRYSDFSVAEVRIEEVELGGDGDEGGGAK